MVSSTTASDISNRPGQVMAARWLSGQNCCLTARGSCGQIKVLGVQDLDQVSNIKRVLGSIPAGSFLCELCMFSRVCVGSLWVLQLPPTVQANTSKAMLNKANSLILTLGVIVKQYWQYTHFIIRQKSQVMLTVVCGMDESYHWHNTCVTSAVLPGQPQQGKKRRGWQTLEGRKGSNRDPVHEYHNQARRQGTTLPNTHWKHV